MISTHILDLNLGQPAADVTVLLEMHSGTSWKSIDEQPTNADGRIQFVCPAEAGVYRLNFGIEEYFKKHKKTPFFISAPVMFHVTDISRKYHIPLLLNTYGYSTYRGS